MGNLRRKAVSLLVIIILVLLSIGGSVLAQQASFVAPILVVNTSFLNVRTGPGVEYTVLVTVVGGTELPVLGVFKDKVWYQVATDAGVGWVNISFTLPRGDFSRVPFADAPVVDGMVVQIDGQGSVVDGQGGGSPAPGTTVGGVPSGRPWGVSVIGGDFRNAPSDKAVVIRAMMGTNLDQVFPLQGQAINEGRLWFATTIPGIGSGWNEAHQFFLRPLNCTGVPNVAVLTRDASGLKAGQEFYIVGTGDGLVDLEWIDGTVFRVPLEATRSRDETRVISFCGSTPVSGGGSSVTTTTGTQQTTVAQIGAPRVIVNTGNLNIRSGPSDGFSIVATVPGGTELPVVGRAPDGVWYLVVGEFGAGWLNNQFVLFRGSYSSVPVINIRYR